MKLVSGLASLSIGLLLAIAPAQAAPSQCPELFFGGQAPDVSGPLAKRLSSLCFSEFAVLHSGYTRTPLYSADHLTRDSVAKAKKQRRSDALETFHEEDRLAPADRSSLKDYVHSGYDRGHMTPNGDMDNAAAQGESFSMANMVPQVPENNRFIWEGVEEASRAMAVKYGEIWVVTMPVFAPDSMKWLKGRVAIPAKIAKAIYIPSQNAASAYITYNADGMAWQAISVAKLRDITGVDAFPALSEQIKQVVISLPEPTPHGGSPTGKSGQPHSGLPSVSTALHAFRALSR